MPMSHLHEYIYANGHATMKLSNIRMGMRFAKNFQFISCCNLTCICHATVMSLTCELWWETLQYGTTSTRDHAILCKFHKTPLRLPYFICVCPAIATRHPHDQSECHTTPLDICHICVLKRGQKLSSGNLGGGE